MECSNWNSHTVRCQPQEDQSLGERRFLYMKQLSARTHTFGMAYKLLDL